MLRRCASSLDVAKKVSGVLCRALSEDEALQGVPLSVDTFYAEVAREAVAAGAHIVNDVSGGSLDPAMHQEVLMSCYFLQSCQPLDRPAFGTLYPSSVAEWVSRWRVWASRMF